MGGSLTPELKRIAVSAGCRFVRPGKGDYDIWYSPHTSVHFPVNFKTSHAIQPMLY
jgi:hypothetical protein